MLDLIDQDDRLPPQTGRFFGAVPQSLPEAGERRLGAVGSNVDDPIAQLRGQLDEKRRLPHLAWPGDELNASGRGLGQAAAERLPTASPDISP